MSNILMAQVTITGTRPVLFSRFDPLSAIPLERETERTGVAGNDPEEWRRRVRMTADRQLYFDRENIFGVIRDGASYTKKGRGSIQPLVVAAVQVMDDVVLVDRFLPAEPIPTDDHEPVYLDVRMVKNPNSKGANVRYRVGMAPGWSAGFRIEWDKTILSRQQIHACLTDGGRFVGIQDGRKIGFGRFCVQDFAVSGD